MIQDTGQFLEQDQAIFLYLEMQEGPAVAILISLALTIMENTLSQRIHIWPSLGLPKIITQVCRVFQFKLLFMQ